MTCVYCLNIVFPATFEEAVSTALTRHVPSMPGFTLLKTEGHSPDPAAAPPVEVDERVCGRIARCVVRMVLPSSMVDTVIRTLRMHVHSEHVVWWSVRVENFGRLG